MPCSRASNSRKPDLVVSLDYLLISLTQHVPRPEPRATALTDYLSRLQNRHGNTPSGEPFASILMWPWKVELIKRGFRYRPQSGHTSDARTLEHRGPQHRIGSNAMLDLQRRPWARG